jgi:hypothetical protein
VWARGSDELKKLEVGTFEWLTDRDSKRRKDEARERIVADLRKRYPEIGNKTVAQIEKGELGTRFHWISGHLLDNPITLTAKRLHEQRQLIAPMERGVRDISQSRELVRAGFALMAKDAVAEVHRGLSPAATENVMTLLRQRDVKITYKVTDEAAHKEWSTVVEQAQKELDVRDTWTNAGLMVGKIGLCILASVALPASAPMWCEWAVPLGVATLWNVGDKLVRHYKGGEDGGSLTKSFLLEGAVDVVFFAVAAKIFGPIAAGGQAAKQTGTEAVRVSTRVIEGPFRRFSKNSVERILKKPVLGHVDDLPADAPKWLKELLANWRKKSAAKASENAVKQATEAGISGADDLARVGAEAVERMSKWVEVSAKGKRLFVTPSPLVNIKNTNKPGPALSSDDPSHTKKLVPSSFVTVGATPLKAPEIEYSDTVFGKKGGAHTPPALQAPNPQQSNPVTIAVPPPLITEDDLKPRSERAQSTHQSARAETAEAKTAEVAMQAPLAQERVEAPTQPQVPQVPQNVEAVKSEPKAPSDDTKRPPSDPQTPPPSNNDTPPGGKPPGTPPDPGASGDAPGRAIAVAPQGLTPQMQIGPPPFAVGTGRSEAAVTPFSDARRGAVAEPSAVPGLQPVANQTSNPHGNSLTNPNMASNANAVGQGVGVGNSIAQPAATVLSLDASMTGMPRPALWSPGIGDALRQNEAVARKAGDAQAQPAVPTPHPQAPTKKDSNEDFVFVARKDKVAMKERGTSKEVASAEGVSRENASSVTRTGAKERAGATEEGTREVARVNEAREAKKHGVAARREERDVARASEQIKESTGSVEQSAAPQLVQAPLFGGSKTNGESAPPDGGGAPAPRRTSKARAAREDARMRNLILQQLMAQHVTKAQREKLLKALLALGISEVEYRKLVAKLGEMDAMRLAQQQADRRKFAEPVAIAIEAPEIKEGVEPLTSEGTKALQPKSQTTRAQLYQRLKDEASTSRRRTE